MFMCVLLKSLVDRKMMVYYFTQVYQLEFRNTNYIYASGSTSEKLKIYSHLFACIIYLFLFHIDCTLNAYHVIIKITIFNKIYRTHYKI